MGYCATHNVYYDLKGCFGCSQLAASTSWPGLINFHPSPDPSPIKLSDEDVDRIAEAVIRKMWDAFKM